MGTWREVKSESELKDGQRVRYYNVETWETCNLPWGDDTAKRFWSVGGRCSVDRDGDMVALDIFDGTWEHVEALFDDDAPATAVQPSSHAATKPIYIATWDGIEYRDGHIGNRTLEQHAARIAELRAELDMLRKRSRRYRAIEKRLK